MAGMENATWAGWETVEQIGRGNFGTVYKIRRTLGSRATYAALKVITIPQKADEIEELRADGYDDESITQYFTDILEKIETEYALMADLKGHANIVYCDDIRTVQHDDGFGGDICIKMELLTPLKGVVDEQVADAQVIKLGMDICSALALCEERQIVHRDIKPENIFVAQDGNFKLGDFGIAKTIEGTMGTIRSGSYEYMAPELNLKQYSNKVDIYSLGMVMYWMLNERTGPFLTPGGKRPTPSMKQAARERRFAGEALPAPAHGSERLKEIVLKACAFDPENRYQTAAQMWEALAELAGKQVSAPVQNVHAADAAGEEKTAVSTTYACKQPDNTAEKETTVFVPDADAEVKAEAVEQKRDVQEPVRKAQPEECECRREQNREEPPQREKEAKKPRKNKLLLPICAGIAVVLLLVLLIGIGKNGSASNNTDGSASAQAKEEENKAAGYAEAMSLAEAGRYAEAAEAFEALGDYKDSANKASEMYTKCYAAEMALKETKPTSPPEKNGWAEENGKTYYYVSDERISGLYEIDGEGYYFDEEGVMCTGAVEIDVGCTYYFDENGKFQYYDAWKHIDAHWSDENVSILIGGGYYVPSNYKILDTPLEGVGSLQVVVGVVEEKKGSADGKWQFHVRTLDGEWVWIDFFEVKDGTGSLTVKLDAPIAFDACKCTRYSSGNFSYSYYEELYVQYRSYDFQTP